MTGSSKATNKKPVPEKKDTKTIASTMEKTKYKYTHKSPDGKSKKLPIYKTAKGKYVVFVNDKKKYLDINKMMKGGTNSSKTPSEMEIFNSFITILESIPSYFADNYLMFIGQRGGASGFENRVSMTNFMNHVWSNKSQLVHFSNLKHNVVYRKIIFRFFMLFFAMYTIWNFEMVFLFFQNQKIQNVYNDLKKEHAEVYKLEYTSTSGEQVFDMNTIYNRLRVESYFNHTETLHANSTSLETYLTMLLSVYIVFKSIISLFKNMIHILKEQYEISKTSKDNKYIVDLLDRVQKKIVDDSNGQIKKNGDNKLALKTDNPNIFFKQKGLNILFNLFSIDGVHDIESFENFAVTVDDKLNTFVKEKYKLITQPDGKIMIAAKPKDIEQHENILKDKLTSISELLHAMHNAQKTMLTTAHNPRVTQDDEFTVSLSKDEVLRQFKKTYKKITSKEIEYKILPDGRITYTTTILKGELPPALPPQTQQGGSKKKNISMKNKKVSKKSKKI